MIDGDRLLAGLRTLRGFGAEGTGVVRPTFSDPDMRARRWLRDEMVAAGLTARIDGVGNVVGTSPNHGPALLIGSHSDTQPTGGWLDGALGVVYALEIARALLERPDTSHLAIDPVAWSDEEGTYTSCLGSRSFAGRLTDDALTDRNASGESVAEAIERVGLAGVERARLDPARHVGYVEAHIEQGPRLEDSGDLIGVVTSIVGIRAVRVTVSGEQNHAGTTPMHRRADAGVVLFEFGHRVQQRLAKVAGPATVWTIGRAALAPGAESIIPGVASCTLQFRDPDDERLQVMEASIVELAAELSGRGPCTVSVERRRAPIPPTVMDPSLREHLRAAAEAHAPGRWAEMASAAGHDAMELAHVLPCAMVFIPSIGGVSHAFAEDSHPTDIVRGAEVLADATLRILTDGHLTRTPAG
jgi:beta-ureidopropionase / N-carbamoyl-L-amino-acid hydrolase